MKNFIAILALILSGSMVCGQNTSSSTTSSNISISVKSTNENYSYSSRFEKDKTEEAKTTLMETLGKPTEETDRTSFWKGKGYTVGLRQGRVTMDMNKDEVTKSFQVKFEDLGEQVSESIGSGRVPTPPKPPTRE